MIQEAQFIGMLSWLCLKLVTTFLWLKISIVPWCYTVLILIIKLVSIINNPRDKSFDIFWKNLNKLKLKHYWKEIVCYIFQVVPYAWKIRIWNCANLSVPESSKVRLVDTLDNFYRKWIILEGIFSNNSTLVPYYPKFSWT